MPQPAPSESFQVVALPRERFADLLALADDELRERGARWVTAEGNWPCRVSLTETEVGERILLTPFPHHDVDSPYRASGPIFVRSGVEAARPATDEIPSLLLRRQLSLRAYDAAGMMVDCAVVPGRELAATIRDQFRDPDVSYLQVHNAGPGCFNCSVVRAGEAVPPALAG